MSEKEPLSQFQILVLKSLAVIMSVLVLVLNLIAEGILVDMSKTTLNKMINQISEFLDKSEVSQ